VSFIWLTPIAAFLLGSIPFGFLVVKLGRRGDVRAEGSGNIGATNVTRVAGKAAGLLTLLLDIAKGFLAVELAGYCSGNNARWMILAAVCVVAGHVFTPWLGFRGGKGVATALGAFLPISPFAALSALLVWILVLVFWRYVSLASMAAAGAIPLLMYILYERGYAPPWPVTIGTIFISLLIIFRHKGNLQRIISGEEHKFSLRE
jgi:acyl phosphate:glycerol-3-phosphate acyltransferase